MKRIAPLFLATVFALATSARAGSLPLKMNFQGKLLDTSNNPKNGSFSMAFNIYDAASGGNVLWGPETQTITVTNGVFSALLGANVALSSDVFAGPSAYLGVAVGADAEMTPRQQLVMSAYAFTAEQLAQTNNIRINAGATYSTFTSAGNLLLAYGLVGTTATFSSGITASSGTFTASGATQYSLQTASGIVVNGGGGVVATFFSGSGAGLTNVPASGAVGGDLTGSLPNPQVQKASTGSGLSVTYGVTAGSITASNSLVVVGSAVVQGGNGAYVNYGITAGSATVLNGLVIVGSTTHQGAAGFSNANGASVTYGLTVGSATVQNGLVVVGSITIQGASSFGNAAGESVTYGLTAGSVTVNNSLVVVGSTTHQGTVSFSNAAGVGLDVVYGMTAGSVTIDVGLVASSGSFTGVGTGGGLLVNYGITAGSATVQGGLVVVGSTTHQGTVSFSNAAGVGADVVYGLSAGSMTIDVGLTASSGSFTGLGTGGGVLVNYGLTAGSITVSNGITASSGSFTASGANQYSIVTSSGINVLSGTLKVSGIGGVVSSSFTGDGSGLTGVAPLIQNSSGSVRKALVAATETVIAYSTITLTSGNKDTLVWSFVDVYSNSAVGGSTVTVRIRVGAAGAACTTASTLIYAENVSLPATAGIPHAMPAMAEDSRGAPGSFTYCMTLQSTSTNTYGTRRITVMEAAPASATGAGP